MRSMREPGAHSIQACRLREGLFGSQREIELEHGLRRS